MKSLAVLLALVIPAFARLGETEDQCQARYGVPTFNSSDGITKRYEKNGVEIHIKFRAGIAVEITFSHHPSGVSDLLSKLTDEQVQALLSSNSAGATWTVSEPPKGREITSITEKKYTRSDGNAVAIWSYPVGTLSIITPQELAIRETEKQASQKAEKETRLREAINTTTGF